MLRLSQFLSLVEEVKIASLDELIEPNLKDDAQFFIDRKKTMVP
jgi:hypothetical protein